MKENRASVLRPYIRTLPVQGCRIVSLEENFQQFLVRRLGWVIINFHSLGVPGLFTADMLVGWILDVTADVSGNHVVNAPHPLVDCLGAPETSTGERCNRFLLTCLVRPAAFT